MTTQIDVYKPRLLSFQSGSMSHDTALLYIKTANKTTSGKKYLSIKNRPQIGKST